MDATVTFSPRDESFRRLAESLRRLLGPSLCALLAEPGTLELLLNADGVVWVDRLGAGMVRAGTMATQTAEALISTVAASLHTTVTRQNPILECELPLDPPFFGARFEALLPPVVTSPAFNLRMRASAVFTLADYVAAGIMTDEQCQVIEAAVRDRLNIVIVGGTGSGKTTLLNAVLRAMAEIDPHHRIVVLEDTAELQPSSPNTLVLRATDTVDLQRLLRVLMRVRPDRPVVGEVRGGEALQVLKAWNTGHSGGACTIHANSARSGLTRLEQMLLEATVAPLHQLIAEAVNVLVFIAKVAERAGRRVTEVLRCTGYDHQRRAYDLQNLCAPPPNSTEGPA